MNTPWFCLAACFAALPLLAVVDFVEVAAVVRQAACSRPFPEGRCEGSNGTLVVVVVVLLLLLSALTTNIVP